MFRIDTSTAAAALPAARAAGVPGFFTDGDPATGVPPTTLDNDWANTVQEELVSIVAAAGAALAKGDHGQVLAAIATMFGVTGNLASKGHIAIPVGNKKLIINWGSDAQADASGARAVTYDMPFSNGPLATYATNVAGGPPSAFHGTSDGDVNGMTVYSAGSSGAAAAAGTAFRFFAIGF